MLGGLWPSLADEVYFLEPGQPLLHGREPVRDLLTRNTGAGALTFTWRAIRTDVSSDATLGYSFGYGQYRPAGVHGVPASGLGAYAIVWRKGTAGAWRVAAFVRNYSQANLATAPDGFASPLDNFGGAFPHSDSAAAHDAIVRADVEFSTYAAARGMAEAFGTFAAPDAALLSGAFGPAAIRASQPPQTADLVPYWRPVYAAVARTGDLGYTVGTAVFTTTVNGAPSRGHTKYVTVWKKQRNGEWKYVLDGGNGSPPPSP
jgi:ketosteroid isomerase-like protein